MGQLQLESIFFVALRAGAWGTQFLAPTVSFHAWGIWIPQAP